MKIAVNTRLLLEDKLEGIGWFTYENLKRITRQHPEHEFVFVFDRPFSEKFIFSDNITPVVAHPQARHPYLWYAFFEWGLPHAMRKHNPDLFLSTDGWISLRLKLPTYNVIHDLNFMHYPEFISPLVRKYYLKYFPKFAQHSNRIATVSEFSKKDIAELFHYPMDKIDVVYNGASSQFTPINQDEQQKVRDTYTQGCPYFLFVGLIHPRKNLKNIIKAFDQFKERHDMDVKLLVVGENKYWSEDTRLAYEQSKNKDSIIMIGRLEPENLRQAYAAAIALVYTSFFEGFGIPILEAMHSDVPTITSDVTSMPEVGGEAALYAHPESVESISECMLRIASDDKLRASLIDNGRKQRKLFSWDQTAEKLWTSIEKLMDEF